MPLYEVQHSASLTRSEKDALATRITQIHQSAFGAPSYFISIVFKDISSCDSYAGPVKQASCNRIFATLRIGGARTTADIEHLCMALSKAWEDIVGHGDANESHHLGGVFATRSIEALMEHGLLLPKAGKDEEWFQQTLPEFERRASEGDVGFQNLVKELGHEAQ